MVASCIATCTSGPGLEPGTAIALYLGLYLLHAGLLKSLMPYLGYIDVRNGKQ